MALIAILIDGLVYASWLFLVSVGLTLVYGVMRVLNVAHGSLYAFGAYAAASLIGGWWSMGWSEWGGFIVFPAAAILVGLVVGTAMERGLLCRLYDRDEVVLVLITYAMFLMFEDLLRLLWGSQPVQAYQPYGVPGVTSIGHLTFSNYDIGLIGVAFVCAAGLWFGLNRTRAGRLLQAVIQDREMAMAMGVNVRRFYTATFVIGAALGALGGAVTAPMISVQPSIGVEVIVLAFAVVVIGGMGSVPGALIGSLLVGLAHAAAVHLLPDMEIFSIYLLMTLVLAVRPQGLLARPAPRRI